MVFFMGLFFIAGVYSYFSLGRSEDPTYTVRSMVVTAYWPGATAWEMTEQVADKIEKKLQETPGLDYIHTSCRPGVATLYVNLLRTVGKEDVKPTWVRVRNLARDIQPTLPEGVQGPFFDDDFGDVYGSIYVLRGKGFTFPELKDWADRVRDVFLSVEDVAKVEQLGTQDETIFVEIPNARMATLGLDPEQVIHAIKGWNAMLPAGNIRTSLDGVNLRVSGEYASVRDVQDLPLRVGNRLFRLGDLATVTRGTVDPPSAMMFYNGEPVLGVEISMRDGGNVLQLGKRLDAAAERLRAELPAGMELIQVFNQPAVVRDSIGEFVETLLLAVAIVLGVSFFSLGKRAGIVVACSIPLVLCVVFVLMKAASIDLHKISLGALIIALGLLVDDAIISVEMMERKLEEGWAREPAAEFAYTATAFPMLTGTLITAVGFMPVGFAKDSSAEYTNALFWVVAMALLTSWVVSVTVIPLLGSWILKPKAAGEIRSEEELTPFQAKFRTFLAFLLAHRYVVIGVTLASFLVGGLWLNRFVTHEFFPPAPRPELIVDLELPEGSTLEASRRAADKMSALLKGDPRVIHQTAFVGTGAPRFLLTMNVQLTSNSLAQFIILTPDEKARDSLRERIDKQLGPLIPEARVRTEILSNGPPSAYPIMLRVYGPNAEQVRALAMKVHDLLRRKPQVTRIVFDWYEKNKIMRLDIDPDRARALGADRRALAASLQTSLAGLDAGEFRVQDKTIDILLRGTREDRAHLDRVPNLQVHAGGGRYIPLTQVARIRQDAEEGLIWRRNRMPAIMIQAEIVKGASANDIAQAVYDETASLRAALPPGYAIEPDGTLEGSNNGGVAMMAVLPVALILILVLLMFQLQSFGKTVLVLLTAPLGLIGVNLALILLRSSMGFVAELGVIALCGMIMRNAVILIDQIKKHIEEGRTPYDAILDSALMRLRPILLTALAAILGMIPLMPSLFWGPMAVAITGGLLVATALTLLYVPALYAAVYRIHPDEGPRAGA
jgi:multidrug efflux pump subunit AcrB